MLYKLLKSHKARFPPRQRNKRVMLRRNGLLLNKINLPIHQQTILYFVNTSLLSLELIEFNSFCSLSPFRTTIYWCKYKYWVFTLASLSQSLKGPLRSRWKPDFILYNQTRIYYKQILFTLKLYQYLLICKRIQLL